MYANPAESCPSGGEAATAERETAMSDSRDDSKITTRRFRRPRGMPARGARGRRVILAVAAAGALAAALLGAPPAHAAGCNLRFYYNFDGSWAWPSESVASDMSCSETPAIVRYTGTGKVTRKALDLPAVHVWDIRDGKAARFRQFIDTVKYAEVVPARA